MVQSVHVGSSLRLARVVGGRAEGLRTFTGVRSNLNQGAVTMFISGFNGLSSRQATQASLTTRARLELGS